VHQILEASGHAGGRRARIVRWVILGLIALSVLGLVLESMAGVRAAAGGGLFVLDVVAIGAFTVEYLLRLWSITVDPRYSRPVVGRLRWALTPMALLDLLAILPFYLPFVVADLRVLRLARVFRLARIGKLARYSKAANVLLGALKERREELYLSGGVIAMLMLVSSSLMYYAENAAQPEVFSSIPAAMWWAIVTLTTVGYGDSYPVTTAGRMLAAATAVLGIAMLALPTAIVTAGMMEKMGNKRKRCPHCGGELG